MRTAKQDWFHIWVMDKKSILETMIRNMHADIEAGYNPMGKSITGQLATITDYRARFDAEMMQLAEKDERKVQHWCYCDLLRRGAISI